MIVAGYRRSHLCKDAPNYEMPADAGSDNVYNVTVVATDAGVDDDDENEMMAMRDVVITVTNEEEDWDGNSVGHSSRRHWG